MRGIPSFLITDHLVFRLHEASAQDRKTTYLLALLILRHLPHLLAAPDNERLFDALQSHLEKLPFIEPSSTPMNLAIQLAFWLGKPLLLVEMIESGKLNQVELGNARFCLVKLGHVPLVEKDLAHEPTSFHEQRIREHLFQDALDHNRGRSILPYATGAWAIWAHLQCRQWEKAGALIAAFSPEEYLHETSPLFFLLGCYLRATEGKKLAMTHLAGFEEGKTPSLYALLGWMLQDKINLKSPLCFWEKMELLRQLSLFYHCAGDLKRANFFRKKLRQYGKSPASAP